MRGPPAAPPRLHASLDALRILPRLEVGARDDPREREADRVADAVADGRPAPALGAAPSAPDARLRRAPSPSPAPAGAPPLVHDALGTPGRPLEGADRASMEPLFGHSLAHVRVHDDARAARSARAVGALAYAVGPHVVFAAGRYAPGTREGRRLLAHEVAHTLQDGGGTLRRTPDAATLAEFDSRATALRAHRLYRPHRSVVEDILRVARARDDCLFFMERLEVLFATPVNPARPSGAASGPSTEERMLARTQQAVTDEQARLATPEGQASLGAEEAATADPARQWTTRRGEGGVIFRVDARDPNDVYVRARVRLMGRGRNLREARDRVAAIRSLEDAIEDHASTTGYTVDLEFTDRPGRDVFTVEVDMSRWTDAGNWVGGARGLAHELHHLFGLDDRYDYTRHASNRDMPIGTRLHWFRVQVGRVHDPAAAAASLMGSGPSPIHDDVCQVAGLPRATCVAEREARTRLTEAYRTARMAAFGRVFQALSRIGGLGPPPPPGREDATRAGQADALGQARRLLGEDVSQAWLEDALRAMRDHLTPLQRVQLHNATDATCATGPVRPEATPPVLHLCPDFAGLAAGEQVRVLMREAARYAGVGAIGDADCATAACGGPCGTDRGDSMARLVNCLTGHAP